MKTRREAEWHTRHYTRHNRDALCVRLVYYCTGINRAKEAYAYRRIVQMLDIVLRLIGLVVWGFFSGLPFVVAPMIAILTCLAIMVSVRGILRRTAKK